MCVCVCLHVQESERTPETTVVWVGGWGGGGERPDSVAGPFCHELLAPFVPSEVYVTVSDNTPGG